MSDKPKKEGHVQRTVYLEERLCEPAAVLTKSRRQSFTSFVNCLIEKEIEEAKKTPPNDEKAN